MTNVQIYSTANDRRGLLCEVDEQTIITHSNTIRDALAAKDFSGQQKQVDVMGAPVGALIFVLDKIKKFGGRVHIKPGNRPLEKVIALWQAIVVLDVQPKQGHVVGQITNMIAQSMPSPRSLLLVHTAFGDLAHHSKPWRTMVHQVGWGAANGNFSKDETIALSKAAKQHPALYDAIEEKYQGQRRIIDQRNAQKAEKAEKCEEAKARRKNRQQARDASLRYAEQREQRGWEEANGLRAASEETVLNRMQHQADFPVYLAKGTRAEDVL